MAEEDPCAEPLPGADRPGILRTAIDGNAGSLTIDYDPKVISDASVCAVAEQLAPEARRRFERCLMRLKGRACEACAMKFERRAERIPGVRRATATFVGGVMSVTYDEAALTPEAVLEQVRDTGAPVAPMATALAEPANFRERLALWMGGSRLELIFTVLTLVFMIAGWFAARMAPESAWSTVFFVLAYGTGGFFGVQAGWQSLKERTVDVDLLMVLAALGAAVVGAPFEGAMLLFLFSLSNVLQAFAIDRTRRAIHSLMKLRPEKALTRRDGTMVLLPIEQLQVGDVVIVRPGESVPLDSEIIEGESALDESSLTGESMPVVKRPGSPVFAGTINQTGGLEIRVQRLAKDSTIEKLIRMVEEAQSEKAETQRFLDRAEQYYAMGVIGFTLSLILLPSLVVQESFRETFYRAMTVMVVASPCALIISTPASILSAIGGAARRGVLFKGGAHLERTAAVTVVALDKTGTLTEGKPRVTDVLSQAGEEEEVLRLAASVESKSEHPLARAIVEEAKRREISFEECAEFQSESGKGARGRVGERRIAIGNPRYFSDGDARWAGGLREKVEALQHAGKTCVVIGEMHENVAEIFGAIAIADVLREGAVEVVRELRAHGVRRIVMLTGDNHRVAAAIGEQAGVDEVQAELLPADKMRVIKELSAFGPVAMVGDGVNDAPALATAAVGIAMGAAGTDVAMETADVVLMSDNLRNIPFAIAISRQARAVVWQNLGFAVAVIVVLVISALGFALPLPLGVVGHEGSTVLVCLNGLRLLAFRGRA